MKSRVAQVETPHGCPEKEPDSVVAGRNREAMLARPMKNIVECQAGQQCRMGSENRFKVLGQKGVTLWMTGLSGAGKTTICKALEKKLLLGMGKNVFNVDGVCAAFEGWRDVGKRRLSFNNPSLRV